MQPKRLTPPPPLLLDVRDDDGHLLFRFCPTTMQVQIKPRGRAMRVVELLPLVYPLPVPRYPVLSAEEFATMQCRIAELCREDG